jgi:hypothetical protein
VGRGQSHLGNQKDFDREGMGLVGLARGDSYLG